MCVACVLFWCVQAGLSKSGQTRMRPSKVRVNQRDRTCDTIHCTIGVVEQNICICTRAHIYVGMYLCMCIHIPMPRHMLACKSSCTSRWEARNFSGPLLATANVRYIRFAESQGKFPPEHIQSVSAQSHNKGVSAFYFGRKVEAEQFLALAYTLSTLTNLMDPLVADAIKKVSISLLY